MLSREAVRFSFHAIQAVMDDMTHGMGLVTGFCEPTHYRQASRRYVLTYIIL
jgi:hypothetical protein